MDQTSMRTVSSRSLIRLIRSMPLPLLREMSMTATSGCVSATRRRASVMSAASPQTSRPGSWPMRTASPSRTVGWSSTIRIRARLLGLGLVTVHPRQSTGYDGTGRLGRLDGQGRANDRGAVAHNAQAHALVVSRPDRYADAVILDSQEQAVV